MRLNILVVCRSHRVRTYYQQLFKDWGHDASCASNARNALKLFISYHEHGMPFDLVFLDYLLEGMNGVLLGKKMQYIYEAVNLVMFPTQIFFEKHVQKDYQDFGKFLQAEPNSSIASYKNIVIKTLQKKELLVD